MGLIVIAALIFVGAQTGWHVRRSTWYLGLLGPAVGLSAYLVSLDASSAAPSGTWSPRTEVAVFGIGAGVLVAVGFLLALGLRSIRQARAYQPEA